MPATLFIPVSEVESNRKGRKASETATKLIEYCTNTIQKALAENAAVDVTLNDDERYSTVTTAFKAVGKELGVKVSIVNGATRTRTNSQNKETKEVAHFKMLVSKASDAPATEAKSAAA